MQLDIFEFFLLELKTFSQIFLNFFFNIIIILYVIANEVARRSYSMLASCQCFIDIEPKVCQSQLQVDFCNHCNRRCIHDTWFLMIHVKISIFSFLFVDSYRISSKTLFLFVYCDGWVFCLWQWLSFCVGGYVFCLMVVVRFLLWQWLGLC